MGAFADYIDALSERSGRMVAWLALGIVIVQFLVVLGRYVFGVGSIQAQESIIYMHGLLFMLAAAYTLQADGHVRIDVFYREASPERKALVDLLGALLLLMPVCVLLYLVALGYVASSWRIFEGSKETSGIHGVYLLKLAILVFAIQMYIQGCAMASRASAALWSAGRPGIAAQALVLVLFLGPLLHVAWSGLGTLASGLAGTASVPVGNLWLSGILGGLAFALALGGLVAATWPDFAFWRGDRGHGR